VGVLFPGVGRGGSPLSPDLMYEVGFELPATTATRWESCLQMWRWKSSILISIGDIRILHMVSERKFKELEVLVKFYEYYSIFYSIIRV